MAMTKAATTPIFWRDEALPFIEGRSIADGRKVCYAKHTHDTFSIGAISCGRSVYLNGSVKERVGAGALVLINPEAVHACNPIEDQPWSYVMLYVDVSWLMNLQQDLGQCRGDGFHAYSATMTTRPDLYVGLNRLYGILTDERADPLQKQSEAHAFFAALHTALGDTAAQSGLPSPSNPKLLRAAEYIRANYMRPVKLDEICAAANLSPSYLIRSFKERYGMTPHAYLVNRRIEYCRSQLRRGRAIADVAVEAGFADQAHLQRAFRQLTAATPGQYQS